MNKANFLTTRFIYFVIKIKLLCRNNRFFFYKKNEDLNDDAILDVKVSN